MALDSATGKRRSGWGTIDALIGADGSAAHRVPSRLAAAAAPARDLADVVHLVCALHGRHPGVVDHVAAHATDDVAAAWLADAATAFAAERDYLAHLAAAVGPMPSTPGQAESEAAVTAQRHALDMLAQSDRAGCAIGAAAALAADWPAIRHVLDKAARRFGIEPPAAALPDDAGTESLVAALALDPPVERAMTFGAQQLLAQHRGLWDLLEARASARDHH